MVMGTEWKIAIDLALVLLILAVSWSVWRRK
jgi:hypothetical protein